MSNFTTNKFNDLINNNYELTKTYKSLQYFNQLYPKWYTYMINKVNGNTNEIRVNVI